MRKTLANTIVGGMAVAMAGGVLLQAARPQVTRSPAAAPRAVRPQTPSALTPPPPSTYRAVLDRYCVTCHNERLRTAGLTLDTLDLEQVGHRPELWEKVVRKLRSGAMPPPGRPRPESTTYEAFASSLEAALDRTAAANPNPGRSAVHRLNRAEYANAIRDLLALDIDSRALLPADDSGHGFDNVADVLSVSPGLLERYMSAATKIGRLAIGDPTLRPLVQTYSVRPTLVQEDRMSEELPFGTRGGLAVRHHFPLDGEYVLKVRLQRTWMDEIRGLAEPHQLEVRLDRAQIKVFTIGGKFSDRPREDQQQGQDSRQSEEARQRKDYEMTADADLEVRFPAKAGTRLLAVTFQRNVVAPEGVLRPRPSVASFSYRGLKDLDPAVDRIEITGPYNATTPGDTASRRQIFVCRPASSQDEEPCARKILSTLARRAYRRPVTEEDVQTLLGFYETGRRTKGFEAGISLALERLLADPDFLFRIEHEPADVRPGTPYRVSDVELASRLSFFLWSSIPDDRLVGLAERGQLRDPAVLEQEVRRMLADARSAALVSNFASQWLYLRNMRLVLPDPEAFPEFDDNLRNAFERETELFVESILREDRSVLDLLRANHTFLNERLARHYQIPNIYGNHFRRVTLTDERRRGLLGQGSILTVTSYAHRTSPVVRGKWLLENVLGAPPPPPPADVPALKENEEGGETRSVRERMEQHRKNPVCASCHARMDPLGFALENFDAIGRWRDTSEAGTAIDASGTLPDGTNFDGPVEFRQALLNHGDEFATTVTEKLLTYALGRGLESYDAPAVRTIRREAAPSDYRWSSLILGIVKSTPFQMTRSREP
jgi:hypothetical protein